MEGYVEDGELFLERAESTDLTTMEKREVQKWLFRVKNELSQSYQLDVSGFETSYEAKLSSRDGEAEFVVDRRGEEVEVNAFVMGDGGAELNQVFTQP
ncbi:MAG: hypothetical protein ABEK59_09715 [Halobacteria archaeon]